MESSKEFIRYFTSNNEGLETVYKYISFLISILPKEVKDAKAKTWILEKLDEFVLTKIKSSEEFIISSGVDLLADVKNIMIYSSSQIVLKILLQAKEKGYKFKVVIVDNPPDFKSRDFCSKLTENGIEVVYT